MGASDDEESDEDNGSENHDGRHITIDTGFYQVTVSGDPDDNIADVLEAAEHAADRAKADVQELDDRMDENGGPSFS